MSPLHRAIALVEMHGIAVLVAEHLHLDMLRARDVFFQKHRCISKRPPRFALRLVQQRVEIARLWTTRIPRPPPPNAA